MEKIIVNAKEFKKGLATLKTLKAKKNDIDLLNFSVSENQLTVTRYVQAEIDEKTSVSVTFLSDGTLENANLSITTKDNLKRIVDCTALYDETVIEFSDYELSVNGFNFAKTETDYNAIDFETKEKINFNTKDFKNAIKKCVGVIDKNTKRNILKNVLINIEENTVNMYATDSYRLANVKTQCISENKNNFSVYLNVANNIEKAIAKVSSKQLDLEYSEESNVKYIAIKADNITVKNVTSGGSYPDIKRLINNNSILNVEVNKKELLGILKTINKKDYFAMDMNLEKNSIEILLIDGSNKISIDENNKIKYNTILNRFNLNLFKINTDSYSFKNDKRFTVAFNKNFTESILKLVEEENLLMSFVGEIKPTTIKEKDTIFMITPIRLDERIKNEIGL